MAKVIGHSIHNPKISVIMATYNREPLIKDSIQSILNQTFTDFELIIVDDGSTDGTRKLVKNLQKKDRRIKLVSQRNKGVTPARLRAIKESTGEFIAIADSDDISLPNRLEREIKQFEKDEHLVLCGSSYEQVNESGKYIDTVEVAESDLLIKLELYFRCPFGHSTVMMRRDALIGAGNYRLNSFAEDYDLWIRMRNLGNFKNLSKPLCSYRVHSKSLSAHVGKTEMKNVQRIQEYLWARTPKLSLVIGAYRAGIRCEPQHTRFVLENVYSVAKARRKFLFALALLLLIKIDRVLVR